MFTLRKFFIDKLPRCTVVIPKYFSIFEKIARLNFFFEFFFGEKKIIFTLDFPLSLLPCRAGNAFDNTRKFLSQHPDKGGLARSCRGADDKKKAFLSIP